MKKILETLKRKWAEYLLEILVITIGILGAFALNNWNEIRKERIQEQLILIGLREEFQQNLEELKSDHNYNTLCLEASKRLLDLNGRPTNKQKIDSLIGIALNYADFDPRVGVVNELITSGRLGLILDERLRYLMTRWSAELEDLNSDKIVRREHWVHHLMPVITNFIPLRNSDKSSFRADYARELNIDQLSYDQIEYDKMLAYKILPSSLINMK